MALSEEERRLLAQMEAALAAEDPKLANALRGTRSTGVHRRRAALAGVGFFAGIALLLAGLQTHWTVSVLGFVLMFVSVAVAVTAWRPTGPGATPSTQRRDPTRTPGGPGGGQGGAGFMDKMEERWRRRQDEGF
ncbi:DUF3040 domain-containing protein [Auraticoccus sp. F435]|uniref:DUF3040 domain-containing protein n=1 Tax=Auraticoccus cholistanensis TaxID=2656650 RepID=A0A6A9UWK3_9ACTN|nr:DUF3040 domain-containing protein [Auraticoccus cholistanensis]MVA77306.1 DUF3040 domain-containing protein [Auraticoccus cholistanensis]